MKRGILKITGGKLKGRKIIFPKDENIRPATSMIREAIFNIIGEEIKDSVILDLFAGSGSIGMEALSRGASFCTFIDNNKKNICAIKENISLLKLEEKAQFFLCDIEKTLYPLEKNRNSFDIIFIDPPYYKSLLRPSLLNLKKSNILKKETLFIVEHEKCETIPKDIFIFLETRRYGNTSITFFRN